MSLTDHFMAHVRHLEAMATNGDETAARSLAAIALLCEGWAPGSDDPSGPDDDGGHEVVDLAAWRDRLAA